MHITVEAPSRGNGMSLPGGIQRQQEEPGAVSGEKVSADSVQKSPLELSNSTISTDLAAQKPLIARAPFNGRNIPIEAPASSAAPEPEPPGKKPPGKKSPGNRLPRTTELPPEEFSRLVFEHSPRKFRLNRKNVNNLDKIVGQPEATVAEHAAREAYAAERAANMNNVERVYMGREADRLINPDVAPGTELSADVVGVTRQGRYVLIESKGTEILHGLEQLDYSANALGREQVVRYQLVVAEQIRTPGFTIQKGTLHLNGQPYLINGKPVHVRTTTQGR